MKAILYYFSGTGNTRLCGQYLRNHLSEQGYETTLYEVIAGNDDIPNPNDYDLIGFGYPIHAFNAPEVFIKFIKKLPKVENKKYFVFKVSGEPFAPNNSSSHHMYRLLKKKGYHIIMEKHFLMPYNIMFKYRDELQKQMYLYLDPLANVMAMRLAKGEEDKIKYNPIHTCWSFLLRIEWIAPKVNALFLHNKKKTCTHCMLCVNNCPTKALHVTDKGKIRTTTKCALCMRCSLNCPVEALHMGIFQPWIVTGGFHYKELAKDENNPGNYVNYKTKGYFKLFRKYYLRQNDLLREYGLPIPVEYNEENKLENLKK